MLEKLATNDVETVTTLFALADKCARAAERRAWHSAPQTGVAQKGGSSAITQDGKKKKKKNRGHDRPQPAVLVIAAATGGWSERNKRPRPQGVNSGSCPVHPNSRHSASECRDIIKLAKRVGERHEQASMDGSPPHRRPGKERADDGDVAAGERDLGYQSPEGVLKDVFNGNSDSDDDNDRRKKLYVMYGGSWELTSRRNVKSLRREVLSVVPGVLKAAPHQRWRSTTIFFEASNCPDNMAGAGILPLITAPVIANMRLHHVLIDGGAGLNIISHAAFKQLQIPGSRLGPSCPFSEVGHNRCIPLGASCSRLHSGQRRTSARRTSSSTSQRLTSPSMPSLAGRPCTSSWPLPIMGIWSSRCRPLLGSSSCGATMPLRWRLSRSCTPWRQKMLARTTEGRTPRPLVPRCLPKVQPSEADDEPIKTIQVGADSSHTTRIAGNLGEK
jgi:hypothetical protein